MLPHPRRLLRHIAAFCGIFFVLNAAPARADYFVHFWEEHRESKEVLQITPNFHYYLSHANFDPLGVQFLPTGFGDYNREEGDAILTYGIFNWFSVYIRAAWGRVAVDAASPLRSGFSYGMLDQSVGLNFRIYEWANPNRPVNYSIDAQVQGDIPAYSNAAADANPSGPTPYLGDQSFDITGGIFATIPLLTTARGDTLLINGGGGYTFRTGGYSMEIPYSLLFKFQPRTSGFVASLGALGQFALNTDSRGINSLAAAIAASAGTGGDFASGAANPSLLTLRATLGYQINPIIELHAGATYSVWGQNAPAAGFGAIGGATIRVGNIDNRDSVHLTPKDYGKSNQGFLNYSLDAHVLRANDRLHLIKIDKGTQDGVELGQVFDIFILKSDGTVGEAVARAKVMDTKLNESALAVGEYFKEVLIDEGFLAKRLVQ
ncbi:MAG: hypothetical protein ACXWPM_09660 [Bdellovibrionota bacterium]